MSQVRLKIDISDTRADEAWRSIRHFDQVQRAAFGPEFGSSAPCHHAPDALHTAGEWIGAEVTVANPLLAQYAVAHYLEQERVLDADVVQEVNP